MDNAEAKALAQYILSQYSQCRVCGKKVSKTYQSRTCIDCLCEKFKKSRETINKVRK